MASVKVAVRVRPFNQREKDMDAKLIVQMDGKKTRLFTAKNSKEQGDGGREKYKDFTFDFSYWSYDHHDAHYASQEQVFADLGVDVIDSAFEGYNACVFAYGQTGSGKTFTMMGSPDTPGLIPRICRQLFSRMATGKESGASYRTEVSYLEIYNEKVKDLLGGDSGHSLRVREHPKLGPYVQDLSKHLVSDYDDIEECMTRGNQQRTTASTQMNDVSSRSHAIFTVTFVQASYLRHNNMPSETASKVHLVDLAGSERADATGATGQRLVEGAHINKSLVTLGSVISALADSANNKNTPSKNKKAVFIPYRDSVLTWLLKDSLGGNSKTIMIAAVSPADCNYGETLSTLRYANRAKNIINKPTINEDPNVRLIRELREEIEKLRKQISFTSDPVDTEPGVLATLQRKEAQEKVLTEKWTEKWRETQQILQEQKALGLRKSGLGVVLDSDMPHLVGIDDNLLSTGVTLYHLKEGETIIGSSELTPTPDIVISGAGVLPLHCKISLHEGEATLCPAPSAHCWLNTVLVDKPTKLSQGCILLLGRTNMFRYNDPAEAAKLRRESNLCAVNLSRLSLLSWSTSELARSAESVNDLDTDISERIATQRSELERSRRQLQIKQEERERSWKAEREQLLLAQRQLDEERAAVAASYSNACRRLSSDWRTLERGWTQRRRTLRARQREINARTRRLTALVDTHTAAADNEESRVTQLQSSLDEKTAELEEFVRASVRELVAKGCRIDESSNLNTDSPTSESSSECLMHLLEQCQPEVATSIRDSVDRHKKAITDLEVELQSRVTSIATHRNKIRLLQKELSLLAAQDAGISRALPQVDFREDEGVRRSKSELMLWSNEDGGGEDMKELRMSLSLSLDPLPSPSLPISESFHTASSTPKGFPSESTLPTPTETSMGLTLSPDGNNDGTITLSSEREDAMTTSLEGEGHNIEDMLMPQFKLGPNVSDSDEMSSTEDYCKPRIVEGQSSSSIDRSPEERHRVRHRRRISDKPGRRQVTEAEALRAMQRLCSRIASQKMLVISSLENDCSKEELNSQIAVLQDLQKKYVRLEMALQYSFFTDNRRAAVTPIQETPSLTQSDNDVPPPTCNVTVTRLKEQELEASDNVSTSNDELQEVWDDPLRASLSHGRSERETYIERDSEQIVAIPDPSPGLTRPIDFNEVISIPGWVVRGAGGATHHEFEVRVSICGSRYLLLRRYRRFRELRRQATQAYGSKVANIPFPGRQLWWSEGVARARRPTLEAFLRRLLELCAADPRCPLYARFDRDSLNAFSPFFRKGVFESGKCGTG